MSFVAAALEENLFIKLELIVLSFSISFAVIVPPDVNVGTLNANALNIEALSMCSGYPSLHTSSITRMVWGKD